MTQKPPLQQNATKPTQGTHKSSPNNIVDPNNPGVQTPNVVVAPMPTLRDRWKRFVSDSQQWAQQWRQTLQQPIHIKAEYSPIRFTRGLTPVKVTFSGWGFCIYNGKIKHFHDSDIALKIPINKQTPILIVGWRQLFKHSLFATSSLNKVPNFSVHSYVVYASANLPTQKINSPNLSVNLPRKNVQLPTTPAHQINTGILTNLRTELSNLED